MATNSGGTPNITPHQETGIGTWTPVMLAFYLETGMEPSGDFAGGAMGDVIDVGTGKLSAEVRAAIAEYILSLPPMGPLTPRAHRAPLRPYPLRGRSDVLSGSPSPAPTGRFDQQLPPAWRDPIGKNGARPVVFAFGTGIDLAVAA